MMMRRSTGQIRWRFVTGGLVTLLLVGLLSGCQLLVTPAPAAESNAAGEDGEMTLTEDQQALAAAVAADMAAQTGASPDEISVVAVEEVTWSDAALGCPQPDMVYAQVLTPGYQITLDYEGVIFTYHTAQGPDAPFTLCEATQ